MATALVNGDVEAAGFTGADRARLQAMVETLRPTGVAPEVAAGEYAKAHAILGGRSILDAARDYARRHRLDLPAVPVEQAIDAFIKDREKAGASVRYLRDLKSRLHYGFAADNRIERDTATAVASAAIPLSSRVHEGAVSPVWGLQWSAAHARFKPSGRSALKAANQPSIRHPAPRQSRGAFCAAGPSPETGPRTAANRCLGGFPMPGRAAKDRTFRFGGLKPQACAKHVRNRER